MLYLVAVEGGQVVITSVEAKVVLYFSKDNKRVVVDSADSKEVVVVNVYSLGLGVSQYGAFGSLTTGSGPYRAISNVSNVRQQVEEASNSSSDDLDTLIVKAYLDILYIEQQYLLPRISKGAIRKVDIGVYRDIDGNNLLYSIVDNVASDRLQQAVGVDMVYS